MIHIVYWDNIEETILNVRDFLTSLTVIDTEFTVLLATLKDVIKWNNRKI